MNTAPTAHGPVPEPHRDPTARAAFVTTQWTAVLSAGREDDGDARKALEQLCRNYWPPLYAYAHRLGYTPHDAQDLTQGFFGRLLELHTVARADPERGRFRSFLLAAFKHFIAHEWEKGRARKRGGHAQIISLNLDTAESHCVQVIDPGDTPDEAFDRQWALAVLGVVLGRLRKEYADAGRECLFISLKETLSGGRSEIPYLELGRRLDLSEGAVKVAAHRLRKRYRELLRAEIANTVSGPAGVEDELQNLFAALGG